MAASIYDNDALENWKRFGGNENITNSYVASTGSSDSLQTPHPTSIKSAAPLDIDYGDANVTGPGGSPATYNPAAVKGMTNATAPLSSEALGKWVNENKPVSPGDYKGGDPYSMHWGGALIGGSRAGIEDYGKWQGQKAQYDKALQNWQEQYAAWQQAQRRDTKLGATVAPMAQPAPGPTSGEAYWGKASTQQQNLGQPATTQPPSPYAVPGQRSTPIPGAGPTQKPDKSLGAVNSRYAGVL